LVQAYSRPGFPNPTSKRIKSFQLSAVSYQLLKIKKQLPLAAVLHFSHAISLQVICHFVPKLWLGKKAEG
jgi:hypothetical protein